MLFRMAAHVFFLAGLLAALPSVARAQINNECDLPGESPDVIVGDLQQLRSYGAVGDITGFSVGTTSCNIGTCWLSWNATDNNHPVIGQGLYRLRDGRFEQLGQSWLKHGFFALSQSLCGTGCYATSGGYLGVNCSDPYSAARNGFQGGLGPKFEVNPVTGVFPYPATDLDEMGDAIYKRIQVHHDDLDPALNPGALYFAEGHYVTKDDAAAGNQNNNASYRPITVLDYGAGYDIDLAGTTQREKPAIQAWQDTDPAVEIDVVDIVQDGRFYVAARATDLGNGMWHYEYAIQNLNSHRAARAVSVPVLGAGTLENVGFHDVAYHSGETQDGTDWAVDVDTSVEPNLLRWSTATFAIDPDANALRWGTLYNFRFDVDIPPAQGPLTVELFRPGLPGLFSVTTVVPGPCTEDGSCDPGEDLCGCPLDCAPAAAETGSCFDAVDNDCDGQVDCADTGDCCTESICAGLDADGDARPICGDCDDGLSTAWSTPGEVVGVFWDAPSPGSPRLRWSAPKEPGGTEVLYEILRSADPADFTSNTTCLGSTFPGARRLTDAGVPPAGSAYHYLVRGTNGCPDGEGALGADSAGQPRQGRSCP